MFQKNKTQETTENATVAYDLRWLPSVETCSEPRRKRGPGQRVRSPDYQKLRVRDIHIWDIRRGQPNRSAMEGPRPGGTALLITVTSTPDGTFKSLHIPSAGENRNTGVSDMYCPALSIEM
ncbi:hypothetical protein AAG570_002841 [Ranatra chinensis]|uniref:Uncharacterized protein n=1 Tax=Ranatra chinensis TaxID=642074 RepID=A0ABD0Y529_9HEMI